MKKTLLWFLKAFLAAVTAFCVISVFCFFYCNQPSHHTTPTKATDYYWDQNSLSFLGTEGFAFTKTDENGYVNTYPKQSDEIDILLMGSSHTEGFNVDETENYAYQLNNLLAENNKNMYAYNIGTSGHTLSRCLRNLESATNEFKPSKYIIIETSTLTIPLKDLQNLDNGTHDLLPSYDSGPVYYLQKSDFFRRVYSQFSNVMKTNNTSKNTVSPSDNKGSILSDASSDSSHVVETDPYEVYLEKALKNASNIAKENGCKLVILHNAELGIDYNGNVEAFQITEDIKKFQSICEKYDIDIVNMHPIFSQAYNETFELPQGFSNTAVGRGHINKRGHSEIAKELYRYITEDNNV
ncbi:MAG: hypothetical protein UH080_08890 [Ruminococcus sp.]|nr:hypothetical protein [Ruminococcus sp.]